MGEIGRRCGVIERIVGGLLWILGPIREKTRNWAADFFWNLIQKISIQAKGDFPIKQKS
jgi:hypothetical protein